ncbi:hypothetical protein FHS04_002847 [Mesoflavibacter sabulilitoris]|uniref:Uncharacterized protein n=1 Tax=Mesoflavibacter zeaxanthinifaciens subsp. sabulilitoris TaxID=1520893 RepID=A0A2T1NNI5_9FLAO|nr:hypothetical protein [Mesoflavibacter zeaxanthinifaciens]MBB3125303.1 hypothetical protein [Mesoflavibacter zeaxanthinifaciens subsp. sabulilitoris]PSG94453.1 hypothetical protein C7H61_00915 [Mesoflavibacter zeaxanthinifaciens subsp. sabulilitoris]
MTETKRLNNTKSKEWLYLITEFLSNGNSKSTRAISDFLGSENKKYKKNERGSKFLIPKNTNLNYIAVNPDLEETETDKPVTYLAFSGEKLNLKLNYLTELFPNVELIENTYDGGIQLFFNPVDNRFDFTAVACQIFTDYKSLDELTDLSINGISFMFKPNKIKTRAGYIMTE